MSGSPNQSLQPDGVEVGTASGEAREKLRRVARYQRWVLFAVLGMVVVNVLAMIVRDQGLMPQLAILAGALVVVAFAIVSVALLANEVYGTVAAVLCGVLMFAPCISLIVLLIVNQKATSYLQQHGIKVGFMGIDPNRIR